MPGDLDLAALRVRLAELPGFDPVGMRTTVHTNERGGSVVVHYEGTNECWLDGVDQSFWLSDVSISAADAATRDRLARWVDPDWRGSTAPRVRFDFEFADEWEVGNRTFSAEDVPALADLDPADRRLLPDGSRLVDALALVAIARHLGGTHG